MSYEELQRAPYSVFQEMYYKFWKDNNAKKDQDEGGNNKAGNVDDNLEDLLDEIS